MESATLELATPHPVASGQVAANIKRVIDWTKIREAYIQRPERQTFPELSAEFGINSGTIANASSDEGWPLLRAQYHNAQLQAADASGLLLRAINGSKAVSDSGVTFGLIAFQTLCGILNDPKMATYAPSTRSEVANTCTFAFANVARGLKDLGAVGISKTLDQAGKEANGQWNPQMLQQINVNVGEIIAKAKTELEAKTTVAEPPKSEPKPTT